MQLLRSNLFVPGNNIRMLAKAATLDCDSIVLDLEDSVPLAEKVSARELILSRMDHLKSGGANVYMRVNGTRSGLLEDDLHCLNGSLDGIMIPKCEISEDITSVERQVQQAENENDLNPVSFIPLIETALGVIASYHLAGASRRNIAVAFGAMDFTRDLGAIYTKEGVEQLFARSMIVIAARAAGVQAIDSIWPDIPDSEGLINSAKRARQMGYSGKLLIHPSQINPVNMVFTPSKEEADHARKVVSAYLDGQAKGLGAVSVDGEMVDLPIYERAKRLLELAEAARK